MLRTDGKSKQLQAIQRRKARERGRSTGFTSTEFEELCKQYAGRCLCCGGKLDLVADHVIPLFKGGRNSIDNIQPLCRVCNSQKHTLTVDFREEANRFRFFVSKSGSKHHIVDNREGLRPIRLTRGSSRPRFARRTRGVVGRAGGDQRSVGALSVPLQVSPVSPPRASARGGTATDQPGDRLGVTTPNCTKSPTGWNN